MSDEEIERTLAPVLTADETARSRWETQFIFRMWDQRDKFERKVIFEDNYQVEYRYQHRYKNSYMIFKFGKVQAKVIHNFCLEVQENVFPTSIIVEMINEAKDIADNEGKIPKIYDLQTRAILWERLSRHFFKCVYMREKDIMSDIAIFTQINL